MTSKLFFSTFEKMHVKIFINIMSTTHQVVKTMKIIFCCCCYTPTLIIFLDKVFIYSWLSIILFRRYRPPVFIFIIVDHARWKAMVRTILNLITSSNFQENFLNASDNVLPLSSSIINQHEKLHVFFFYFNLR
jgi:hypothetical protein